MRKIMIDTGMTRRVNCRGVEPDTVELIGSALSRELDARGCETMTSCGVPDPDEGFGRPSRCADVARRWGADCLLRLYVRAAADPCAGSADAMVYRRKSRSGDLAQQILRGFVFIHTRSIERPHLFTRPYKQRLVCSACLNSPMCHCRTRTTYEAGNCSDRYRRFTALL